MKSSDLLTPPTLNSPNTPLAPGQLLNAMHDIHGGNLVIGSPEAAIAAPRGNNALLMPLTPGGHLLINGIAVTPATPVIVAAPVQNPPLITQPHHYAAAAGLNAARLDFSSEGNTDSDNDDPSQPRKKSKSESSSSFEDSDNSSTISLGDIGELEMSSPMSLGRTPLAARIHPSMLSPEDLNTGEENNQDDLNEAFIAETDEDFLGDLGDYDEDFSS